MKCLSCQTENKDEALVCRKCGVSLTIDPLWKPTWRWHFKVLGIVYCVLLVAYFSISYFLSTVAEPYRMRERPKDVTPWLK